MHFARIRLRSMQITSSFAAGDFAARASINRSILRFADSPSPPLARDTSSNTFSLEGEAPHPAPDTS
jgi:hypothetical protein